MAEPAAAPPQNWTIGALLAWTKGHFEKSGVDDARLCAELLLAQALGCKRIELYARFDVAPSEAQRAAFRELVRAAAEHQPIAYLIGRKEFYSLDFKVTPDVLIPRPETELLVELALAWCKAHAQDRYSILDLGTGSGCIGVTLAKRLRDAHVTATDISAAALSVASANAAAHGVSGRIAFIEADLFDWPAGAARPDRFHVILSNPPYVAESDRDSLPENVRRYEPAQALFAGPNGLDIIRRMAEGLGRRLESNGMFAVEVGMGQADAVERIFIKEGGLALVGRYKDGAGIERALEFRLPA